MIGSAFTGNAFSVPMSNAANQAQVILQQNLSNWQNLPAVDQTSANQATFVANFNTIWNAYVTACNTIAGPNPTGNAEKALLASVDDRERGGKFDWFAGYLDPIANSATPGNTMTSQDLSAQQLETFVLSALVNNNSWTDANGNTYPGDGCAQIAAAQVTPILGTGTETQFQFQGALTSQKPFRDWLTEVLNCCLGYYTWEFGKLKLGCRINASATDTYTLANILFQSLKLTPIQAAFEHLVISYGDVTINGSVVPVGLEGSPADSVFVPAEGNEQEGPAAGEHFVEQGAERENVRPRVHLLRLRLLRRHETVPTILPSWVLGAAPWFRCWRGRRSRPARSAWPSRIQHLHQAVVVHYDIREPQVAMDDAGRVRRRQRVGNLDGEL